MINTNVFDYINVLQKTADAAWIRNDVISNNIANATTPGYKRQDVAFEDELANALGRYEKILSICFPPHDYFITILKFLNSWSRQSITVSS